MKIAVVGSGIAGLSAAWLLSERHTVTLFERRRRVGMNADSIAVNDGAGTRVDVPLRVVYSGYYRNLMALYERAGIQVEPVDYSASFSSVGGGSYFRYYNLLLRQRSIPYVGPRQVFARKGRRLLFDVLRFYAQAGRAARSAGRQTIVEALRASRYSSGFVDGFLLPALASICTCRTESAASYPADIVFEYFASGLFFSGVRRTVGGTGHVVERLMEPVAEVRRGTTVVAVIPGANGVRLRDDEGHEAEFEHVVIATQANQARDLLPDTMSVERDLLGRFSYESSEIVVHSDTRLMPRRRRDWAPVNFLVSPDHDKPMASIWMNAVQPELRNASSLVQTWNPIVAPREDSVLARARFRRPVVTPESQEAVDQLQALQKQPGRRVWFSGSYSRRGIPLLESAATSAIGVVEALEAGSL